MSDLKTPSHVCVLCNAKLASKEALQEHFRKHANREIDGKGRPRKPKFPGGIITNGPKKSTVPAVPQTLQRVNAPSRPAGANDSPVTAPGDSPSSSSSKPPITNNSSTPTVTKSPGKSSSGIVCDVCGQEFETVTIAIQHKFKKHPDSAIKHFCPHCGQQFPLKINRDKHLQIHPSDPPSQLFPCQECGVVFYNTQAQSYHFKSTHKRIVAIFKPVETPPPSKKIRLNNAGEAQSVYYCHICGYEYIIKFNLQKHIERHHPEEERNAIPEGIIKCTTCDALFYSKKAYDNHNMYHRPDDLYVTSEEQRLQTVSRVDQDFDIRRVQPGPEKFIPLNRPRPARPNPSMTKVESKKSLRKFKGKKNNSQKSRRKAGTTQQPEEEGLSDTTDESDPSSDSELSPDSGPDSDSDSDVPLKKSTTQRVAKEGQSDPGEKKRQGTTKRAMPKSQAKMVRKKVKLEKKECHKVKEEEGEGGIGEGSGGGKPVRGERKRGRGVAALGDLSKSSLQGSSKPSGGGARGTTGSVKVKQEVVNGGKEVGVVDAKVMVKKDDVCKEEVGKENSNSGDRKNTTTVCKGRGAKDNSIVGQGSEDKSCSGRAASVSEQIGVCAPTE